MEDFNFEKQLILCQEDLMKAALILLPDMDDAKDLLQDTMLKALDNKESYSVDANFKGWLYIIMHNLFYNRCRSKKRKPELCSISDPEIYAMVTDDLDVSMMEDSFDMILMKRTIRTLPDAFYIPFLMFFYGYKYKDIAEITNAPISTVKTRIFYCRRLLKVLFGGMEKKY